MLHSCATTKVESIAIEVPVIPPPIWTGIVARFDTSANTSRFDKLTVDPAFSFCLKYTLGAFENVRLDKSLGPYLLWQQT